MVRFEGETRSTWIMFWFVVVDTRGVWLGNMFKTMKQIIKNKSFVRSASSFSQAAGNWAGNLQAGKRQIGVPRAGSVSVHPRRPRGSQSGREKRRHESFQARAEEPMGTDSQRTISKRSSECWLLIGHKKCFVLLWPIGKQFLLSSFRVFEHDGYYLATVAPLIFLFV